MDTACIMMNLSEALASLESSVVPLFEGVLSYRNMLIACLSCFILYLIFKPMNWIRGVEDVGWLSKEEMKKKAKLRKMGGLPPVYPNGWFVLAESTSVNKEQVVHVAALGENFAIFRTKSGEVRILDAYCPHMGANMAAGGKVRGDCLECPFHLWRFSGETGFCVAAPIEKVPKSARVKKWLSHESNDFIYVWYHAERELPTWYPPTIPQLKELTYFGRNQYDVNCHIQEIPENGSDFTHFMALHESSVISGGDLRYHESKWFQVYRHCWESSWEAGTKTGEEHMGYARLVHHISVLGKIKLGFCTINVQQVGPGFVALNFQSSVGQFILLQTVTPTEPLLQRVIHRVYSLPHLVIFAKLVLYNECIMFERDIMIWNNKAFIEKPLFTKEDASIAKYRRWFSQFYSEHSPTYKTAKEGFDC